MRNKENEKQEKKKSETEISAEEEWVVSEIEPFIVQFM